MLATPLRSPALAAAWDKRSRPGYASALLSGAYLEEKKNRWCWDKEEKKKKRKARREETIYLIPLVKRRIADSCVYFIINLFQLVWITFIQCKCVDALKENALMRHNQGKDFFKFFFYFVAYLCGFKAGFVFFKAHFELQDTY